MQLDADRYLLKQSQVDMFSANYKVFYLRSQSNVLQLKCYKNKPFAASFSPRKKEQVNGLATYLTLL